MADRDSTVWRSRRDRERGRWCRRSLEFEDSICRRRGDGRWWFQFSVFSACRPEGRGHRVMDFTQRNQFQRGRPARHSFVRHLGHRDRLRRDAGDCQLPLHRRHRHHRVSDHRDVGHGLLFYRGGELHRRSGWQFK